MKSFFKKFGEGFKAYVKNNKLVVVFICISLINDFMLRVFTVKFAYNQIKPLMADMGAVMIFSLLGFCFKSRRGQFIYLMTINAVLTFLCAANSIYYTNYKSFASFSQLSTASQLGGVMNAVTENIMEPKDLLFLWTVPALIVSYILINKHTRQYDEKSGEKGARGKYALQTFLAALAVLGVFCLTLSGTDYSRLRKQWNREYVLGTFGIYIYQSSDAISVSYSNINMMFGYEDKKEAFTEFYDEKDEVEKTTPAIEKANEYSNIFEGKNVIVIHGESIQQFCLDTYINGQELTPNLNKLAKEGLYFSNFYAQESVGTSSDSEFTFSTSLMPASSGTVAINYYDRDYTSIQKLLKEKGYYIFSMHGNNGSYWNRMNLHMSLGYDRFFNYTDDFVIDETIGLGLSDKSFFRQAIPKIQEINENNENWYGCFLMLTNHTPFTDIERVSDLDVSFRYKRYNSETGLYEEISAPFLEGTKLGSYLKSVHYADEALGQFLNDLDENGLLDNTVFVLYGDHDAKVKPVEYEYYLNYNPFTDTVLTEEDDGYVPVDDFYYNLNRRVPFIIWSKGGEYEPKEFTQVMGMYDAMPTLGNMLGFENKYALGHDIFSFDEGEENVVIFPTGNFVTDKVYYDSQKNMYFDLTGYENVMTKVPCNQVYKNDPDPLYTEINHGLFKFRKNEVYCEEACEARKNDGVVEEWYIDRYSKYADERIDISNAIIYYDMINKTKEGFEDIFADSEESGGAASVFTPSDRRRPRIAV